MVTHSTRFGSIASRVESATLIDASIVASMNFRTRPGTICSISNWHSAAVGSGVDGFAGLVLHLERNSGEKQRAEHHEHRSRRRENTQELADDELPPADRLAQQREGRAALDFVGNRDAGGPHGQYD